MHKKLILKLKKQWHPETLRSYMEMLRVSNIPDSKRSDVKFNPDTQIYEEVPQNKESRDIKCPKCGWNIRHVL